MGTDARNATSGTTQRFLELLFDPGDVFEIRAPACRDRRGRRYTCSGYFAHSEIETAATAIAELDNAAVAPGIYVTLNPVATALLARSANRIKTYVRETTQDKDIARRRWLLIDVDPVRPAGVSSSEPELAAAHERALAVREHLTSQGWPEPIFASSGNGLHLLYRVDLPAADGGLVQRVLAALAERFDDERVSVDRSVHNAARITKVIGTRTRKGDELADVAGVDDRPHRRAELIEAPERAVAVPAELLERLPAPPAPPPATIPTYHAGFDHTPDGVRRWLESHGVAIKGERRDGAKTLLLLERCPVNPEIESTGTSDIAVLIGDDGKLAYCNKHNRGADFTWRDLRQALEPGYMPHIAPDPDVDLSQFMVTLSAEPAENEPAVADAADPGPVPEELLRIPGFVSELMDHSLKTAPYPNVTLAFCGALAMQSFLAARKVRDAGDNRTNLYLLALANSSAGKDWPRKINTRLLWDVGLHTCLGDKFSSGEGLQDALYLFPAMLFQTDEIDTILQAIRNDRDGHYQSLIATLLQLYTSAASIFPMRKRARKADDGVIDQPSLTIFGTAIPGNYYEALSGRALTNGLFARMLVLDAGKRATGQEPGLIEIPERVRDTAQWWADLTPGGRGGNLQNWHPDPLVVDSDDDGSALLTEVRADADDEYAQAEHQSNEVAMAIWGRANENVRKLSLLYAISADHKSPRITEPAVAWARRIVWHVVQRMLYMAGAHVADGEFDAYCLRLIRKLKSAPRQTLAHSLLLKRMKMTAKAFRMLVETLVERGDIEHVVVPSGGRPQVFYHLTVGKEGGERCSS